MQQPLCYNLRMKRFCLALFALSLLFGVSGPIEAAGPIKIGLTLGLSGKYSEMSDMQMKGLKLWEKEVNSKGGILGKSVQVIIYDDKSDTRVARSLYENLLSKDRVDLVFGPYSSQITEAILPVTEKNGYPVLVSGASADKLWEKGYKYVFGTYTPASKYAVGFLEMLVAQDLNDIAIVYADDLFSTDIASGTRKWAERFGLRTLLYEGFKDTSNFDELARTVRAANVQVLIVCGHFDASVALRLSLKKIGWYPRAYFASVGPTMQAFYDRLKKDVENVFSSSQWERLITKPFPGCCEFHERFVKAYKKEPSYHAATAYAAGQILEAAVKRAGSLDRDKVRDMLASMEAMSIMGRYGVNRTGKQIKHFNLIIQWQNGRKEVVWPDVLRTAKPVFR